MNALAGRQHVPSGSDARSRPVGRHVDLVLGDAQALELADSSFDTVARRVNTTS
jgi:hypothetical protein